MIRSSRVRSLLASAAVLAAIALGGCQVDGTLPANSKAMAPLSPKIVAEMNNRNMDKEAPILIRIFKQESELEIWKQDRDGKFALLKTYPICRWSGELGPKIREGDRQAPEGFYTITPGQMNPNSAYYLSFDLGYPNAFDRSLGRTGAQLMVHGDCSSRGCYSMTDEQIAEIYALGREAFFGGQKAFQVQAYPFRMTAENMAKHRNNPHMAFWKMLKRGSDHFEVTRLQPKVNVCDRHYVFDAETPANATRPLSFSPAGKCPVYEVPAEIAQAVQEKEQRDEVEYAALVRRNVPLAPIKTYTDGGMHPIFANAVKRNEVGTPPSNVFSLASVPGTIPAHVQPPKAPDATPPAPDFAVTASTSAAPDEPQVQVTQVVPAETAAQPSTAKATTGNFFSNLFASPSVPTATKDDGPIDRMAKLIGLRNSDPKAKPVPQHKSKVATRPHAPNQVARPKPTGTKPVADAPAEKPATAAPAHSTIAGAVPAVPAGSFDSRWQAFR